MNGKPMSNDASKTQRIDLDNFNTVLGKYRATDSVSLPRSRNDYERPFNVFGETDPGLARTDNEDNFGFFVNNENHTVIGAIADGIGGHDHGDIASKLAIEYLLQQWREFQAKNIMLDPQLVDMFLRSAIERINTLVYNRNREEHNPYPMGTTLTVAVILKKFIITANAGDSRVYRLRKKSLKMLTEDHTLVAELVRRGRIAEKDALTHPYAHIISKSIGPAQYVNPDIIIYDRFPDDKFLICSDGLNLHLSDKEIEAIMIKQQDPKAVVKTLIMSTLRKGGKDNIAAVCID